MESNNSENQLLIEIIHLIEDTRSSVSHVVSSAVSTLYWNIGNLIQTQVLLNQRADYGKEIVATLSRQLVLEYGNIFEEKNLRRMIQFAQIYNEPEIVATLWRQLTWSHFKLLIPLKDPIKREFYTQMCSLENWNVRTLQNKINSMLFERTAISQKPEDLAKQELMELKNENKLSPNLVFRDPYILDFLGLKDTYSEKDLEQAILREIEKFILELGIGFTFMARQKRMIIDGEDYHLDLLFYNRKLKRLVAIDLKIGKFEAGYKGQMELYLRWLEKNETEPEEEAPIGLILCAQKNNELIELLQLDSDNIRVAEYITQYLPKNLLKQKLHQFMIESKNQIEVRKETEEPD
jgi:predicted nuclease of restriction endonuclease-like (RecB) superfamily